MITIKNITFWYSKQNKIFENLTLDLDAGHIYGLLGKNGAGKTTLLKIICGLSFPKTGFVAIDGLNPVDREPKLLSELFFVPEEISLPALTAEKFAVIHGGFYPAYDHTMFLEFLGKFEVDKKQNLSAMSRGQKKKAMLAFALATNARFLFLDEPTDGLDIPSKAAFRSMLAATLTEEKTIILSTHMVRDLESMIDSVIILDNHRIILNKHLEKIAQKLTFAHSYLAAQGEIVYSGTSELGPAIITKNPSAIPGNVDLETLFTASITFPEKILTCLEN